MKATELMVGDWFKAVDYNSPFRITAIYEDVVQTQADYQSEIDGNWYSEAEIKDIVPIELTEEILVKNGFVKGRDDDVTTFKYGNLFLFYYPDGTGLYYYNSQIIINYVHQLQHLLRLVASKKEIEL